MFCNKKLFLIFFIINLNNFAYSSVKGSIINKLTNIENLSFKFEQNINGKIETGNCTIKYPKKIYCKYNQSNNKILVSNGKSLVIKTITSYYIYPLKKTPLEFILDKEAQKIADEAAESSTCIPIGEGENCW